MGKSDGIGRNMMLKKLNCITFCIKRDGIGGEVVNKR